ncbi:MAG: RNA pyrophosphohydrolase [Alphaproteobacteria bacterium]|nr:RNA pyrophosphohydrolase [Alphaproteobacteria bacterium]
MSVTPIRPPPPDPASLPYRPCVGVLLLNARGEAWTGRRIHLGPEGPPAHRWQLPQGGIDPGEDPAAAALRELAEEAGTGAAELLAEYPDWLAYDFPPHAFAAQKGRFFRGQKQKWYALRFTGRDDDFNLAAHMPPEFDAWAWRPLEELPSLIVPFKRPVYDALVAHFRPLALTLAARRDAS